jgi:hypothetical protein
VASAINLTRADMRGYTPSPNPSSGPDSQAAALAQCAGATPLSQQLVDVSGEDFSRGSGLRSQQASSDVTVMPTVALVARDFAALASARGQACLRTYLTRVVVKSNPSSVKLVGGVTLTQLPIGSLRGVTRSVGLRIVVTEAVQRVRIPVYIDAIALASGRLEVSLSTFSIQAAFPASEERRLLAVLAARTASHQL